MTAEEDIIENHKIYLERKALYKSFGYDIDKERAFIIEKSQPLYGDILEAGIGKGYFALALAKEGYCFTAFDISETEQKFARLNLKYFRLDHLVDFRIEDGENLSFKDKSFDIIFSVNTFHHLANPYKVLNELIRVLSFEGKLILSDFTERGMALMDEIHAREGRKHQASKTALTDLERYLIEKGFKIDRASSRFQEVLIAYHQLI